MDGWVPIDRDRELGSFPRKVAELLAQIINEDEVRWRLQNGAGHIYLYPDDGTRPFKVSASRMEERSVSYLARWAKQRGYGRRAA